MFNKTKFFLFLGICLFANTLWAQTLLNEVVFTANKTEQKLSQTGKVITVLSDSVLQKYQGQTVAELLAHQVGFTIVGSNGALGSNQELYLRGASNGNTLILIDGVPAYDPSYISSGFDLNLLNVCECERIEILKGAQSTLYGSDAVAGVINIFTKKGTAQKPLSVSLSTNGGSFGTYRNTLAINGLVGKFYYNVQYSNLSSKGISSVYSPNKSQNDFEKDGYHQNNFMANLGFQISDKITWKAKAMVNKYLADLDYGPMVDEKDYTTNQSLWMLGTSFEYKTEKDKIVLNYNFGENKRIYTNDSTFIAKSAFDTYSKADFGGQTHFVDLYWSKKIQPNFQFVLGSDLRLANLSQSYLSISSFGKYEDTPIGSDTTKTSLLSIYGSGLWNRKSFFMEIGGRLNMHSIYGNNFTYSMNPSYDFNKNLKAFINISSGFKAPSLYQLYSPFGNKNLKPEQSVSSEFGFQLFTNSKKSNIRALYFKRNMTQVIFFEYVNFVGKYINFDKQADQGIEIEANSQFGKWNIFGNYTYVTGKISQKDTSFNNLFRRPKHSFNLGVGYQLNVKLYSSIAIKSLGKRTDRFYNEATFATENTILNAYQTIDWYTEYKFSKKIKTYIDLKNITNTQYFDSYGYSTKPFNLMMGINFNF